MFGPDAPEPRLRASGVPRALPFDADGRAAERRDNHAKECRHMSPV